MAIKKRPDTDTVWPDFFDYFRRDFGREILGWRYVIRYFGMLTPLILVGLIALFFYVDPIPPKKAYIATGQPGSSYHVLSEKFSEFFAKHGFELVLVPTPGLDQGFQKLNDEKSPVNASFLTAGSAKAADYPELVSLGSLQYSPVWLVYRGPDLSGPDAIKRLASMRVAVGMNETNTNKIWRAMLGLHGIQYESRPNFLELPHQQAAADFKDAKLDAVFVVDDINSPTVESLLALPDIKIFDFNLIDAYVKKLPFLEKVDLPRGSLSIEHIFPPTDTDLLASSITLLVEKKMHPVHQWLFLMAAKKISEDQQSFFARPGFFPAYLDRSIPLSPIAAQYYESGIPGVFKYFPLWVAALFNRMWVIVLTLFALIYPLFKFVLNWRNFPSDKLLGDYFQDLRDIESDLLVATTREEIEHHLKELDDMEASMLKYWYEENDLRAFYTLRMTAMRNVRVNARAKLAALPNQVNP